jgi:hypothetical protein
MYRRYQNRAIWRGLFTALVFAITSRYRQAASKASALCEIARTLSRDHKRPYGADKIVLGRAMLDQRDHLVSP